MFLLPLEQFNWDWGEVGHSKIVHDMELAEIVNLLEFLGYDSFLALFWALFVSLVIVSSVPFVASTQRGDWDQA